MAEVTYGVEGMTCEHCVAAVQREVGALDGVESAVADLATGTLTVTGQLPAREALEAAVAEAGYTLS